MRLLVQNAPFIDANLPTIDNHTQAAIYARHVCTCYSYGFVTFNAGIPVTGLRSLVQSLGRQVSSSSSWEENVERYLTAVRTNQAPAAEDAAAVQVSLGISARGYVRMGFKGGFTNEFIDGFPARAWALGVNPKGMWTDRKWSTGADYHLLLILAGRQTGTQTPADVLQARKTALEAELGSLANVTWEDGYVDRSGTAEDRPKSVEHFGFVDGIGNPAFFDDGPRPAPKYGHDTKASLSLVLIPERFPAPGIPHQYGTFSVFMKISQNVEKFLADASSVAAATGHSPAVAQELMIGRQKDGTPINHTGNDLNDLNPAADQKDWPSCSHTRKVSWRGAPHRRILRRGVLYKEGVAPASPKGLLFHSFQKSIAAQFEVNLRDWANSASHPAAGAGVDPLIGDPTKGTQQWPHAGSPATAPLVPCPVGRSVNVEGGEYFYFPSIPSLQNFTAISDISPY